MYTLTTMDTSRLTYNGNGHFLGRPTIIATLYSPIFTHTL